MLFRSVVFGHSRYHLPLMPFLAMYAAAAVVNWTLVKRRVAFGRLALAATACLALGAAWLHEVLFRDAEHVKALLDRLT